MVKILFILIILLYTNISFAITEDNPIYTSHNGEWYATLMNERGQCYNGKCYIVFEGNNTDNPYMMQYTVATDTWSSAQFVGTNPLSGDAHGNPAMLVDSSGYIHVFYGAHNTAGFEYRKSTNPEDITSWTTMTDIGVAATYPQAFLHSNGDIELFYRDSRTTGDWVTILSTNGGSTWSTDVDILNQTGVGDAGGQKDDFYAVANLDNQDRLHINFVLETCDSGCSPTDRRNNYYIYRDGSAQNSTWRYIDGTAMTLPITYTYADANCRIETTTTAHQPLGLTFDSSDNPYLMLDNASADGGGKIAKWNGSSWDTVVYDSGGGGRDLYIDNANNLIVYETDSNQIQKHVIDLDSFTITKTINLLNDFTESPTGARLFKDFDGVKLTWFSYTNSPNPNIWVMTEEEEIESGRLNKINGVSGLGNVTFN